MRQAGFRPPPVGVFILKRTTSTLLALAILATPAISSAQDAPAPAAGTAEVQAKPAAGQTVYDPAGAEVGTITSISGDSFVINTGTNTATLALSSLASGAKGPSIAMTKAQLDAAVATAKSGSASPQAPAQ